jgi:hypothetical protein
MKLKTIIEKTMDFIFPPLSSWKTYENEIGAPIYEVYIDEIVVGISLREFCFHVDWIPSNSEFRKLVKSNGIKVNGEIVKNESKNIWLTDIYAYSDGVEAFRGVKITKGKQDVAILKLNKNKRPFIERIRWRIEQKLEYYNII